MSEPSIDGAVREILKLYESTKFCPPAGQFTVLASFFLTHELSLDCKIISIGTGTKCLPTVKLPSRGEALHDSHAEVIARRGAIRWFYEEIGRTQASSSYSSSWLVVDQQEGGYRLCDGAKLHLYISTVPCGDASTRYLAAFQDEEMATLKDSAPRPVPEANQSARGRDNYSLYGVLRTKPGRADSPPTLSMSCSDKIALWCALGIQGALGYSVLGTIYIETIVIGEVPSPMRLTVYDDCTRAFNTRLQGFECSKQVRPPAIVFTSIPFVHARLDTNLTGRSSCNESLSWIADTKTPHEVLINGLRRGVSPKHRYREKSRPRICKMSLFQLWSSITGQPVPLGTYLLTKRTVEGYQTAKSSFIGSSGPFSGWQRSSFNQEQFTLAENTET